MYNIVITVMVCIILGIAYIYFGKEQNLKRKKITEARKQNCNYFCSEIEKIPEIKLAGTGNDSNSDYEFSQALEKVNLSEDVRIKLYD